MITQISLAAIVLASLAGLHDNNGAHPFAASFAFAPIYLSPPKMVQARARMQQPLWYAVNTECLPDISDMTASEMKKELEIYGFSTKSMFDKNEFEKALKEARIDEEHKKTEAIKERIRVNTKRAEVEATQPTDNFTADTRKKERKTFWGKRKNKTSVIEEPSKEQEAVSGTSREARYSDAMQDGIKMKISELKQELKERGISTSAFFEKMDMAKAYAEAVADNIMKKNVHRSSKAETKKQENYDPSYRDVAVQQFDATASILPGETVIDITDLVKGRTAAT